MRLMLHLAENTLLFAWCYSIQITARVWLFWCASKFPSGIRTYCDGACRGRSLKDLMFSPPLSITMMYCYANLETHFIDSSGLISWDLFKETPDCEFADWGFAVISQEEYNNLMAIFQKWMKKKLYVMDYNYLTSMCRTLVPGMSDIYPADDLILRQQYGNGLARNFTDLPNWYHDAETQELLEELDG